MMKMLRPFEGISDGACAVDAAQKIIFWNTAAAELLGYDAEEALGRSCWSLLAGRAADGRPLCHPDCPIFKVAMEGRAAPHFPLIARTRSGQPLQLDVSTLVLAGETANEAAEGALILLHLFRPALVHPPSTEELLRLYFLGPVVVWRPDGSLVGGPLWRRDGVQVLLAHLASHRGEPVGRDVLLETLWGELPMGEALSALTTALYFLRRSLEPRLKPGQRSCFIRKRGDSYCLVDGGKCWLDVQAFEGSVRQARLADHPGEAIAIYRRALSLYRGYYLADVKLREGWFCRERERLHELFVAALEETGSRHEEVGQYTEAQAIYRKVLELQPGRESAHRLLGRVAVAAETEQEERDCCQGLSGELQARLESILAEQRKQSSDGPAPTLPSNGDEG